jgi:ABC-type uncharacterized transport system substrate-binding protein
MRQSDWAAQCSQVIYEQIEAEVSRLLRTHETFAENIMKNIGWLVIITATLMGFSVSAQAQQQTKLPRMGLLSPVAPPPVGSPTPFDRQLRQLGYVEGQNIAIERRYANGQMNRLPALAADLARLSVDVIVAGSFPAALAAKEATTTIPIVVFGAGDQWLQDSSLALLDPVET